MNKIFAKFTNLAAAAAGHPLAFLLAVASVVIWGASGPLFGFSETWQLVINTATTIITFLMVFVIQNAQNRDGAAIQAKLDELIGASTSENDFIGIERLPQDEVEAFRKRCEAAAKAAESTAGQPKGSAERQGSGEPKGPDKSKGPGKSKGPAKRRTSAGAGSPGSTA